MPFNPAEVASLQVNDVTFFDWETVEVQHRWNDGWPTFRFTAAENAVMPVSWIDLQFKPGDACTIRLGGVQAIDGIILTRQTAYDANNHTVELAGAGRTWAASTSSVASEDANCDGLTLQAIADKVFGRYGVSVRPVGTVDAMPFPECQAQKGELVFDFVEHLARQRGATLGSDQLGNMLLIGDHMGTVVQQLTEGENIKKMQCVISNGEMASLYSAVGQAANAESMPPGQSANVEKFVNSPNYKGYQKFIQTVLEHPFMNPMEVAKRAEYEAQFRDGTQIRANVTVQGWLRDGVDLWTCGDDVIVNSPMAMLNFVMKIQTLTFRQDNESGTTTELELVMPWMLSDRQWSGVDSPANAPTEPSSATDIGPTGLALQPGTVAPVLPPELVTPTPQGRKRRF